MSGNSIFESKLNSKWDYEKNKDICPKKITINSSKKFWWKCQNGHSYQEKPTNEFRRKNDCSICSGTSLLRGYNDFLTKCPDVKNWWNYELNEKGPEDYLPRSGKKVHFVCPKDSRHVFKREIRHANKNGKMVRCPICCGQSRLKDYSSLYYRYPQLREVWSSEKNKSSLKSVFSTVGQKYWWNCGNGLNHFDFSSPRLKIKGQKCTVCAGRTVLKGFNDLATRRPESVLYWDFEKNDIKPSDVVVGSDKKVWWRCNKGHSNFCKVSTQARKNFKHCRVCGEAHVVEGVNDLKTKHEKVGIYWAWQLNDKKPWEVAWSIADKKYWFVCKNGHEVLRSPKAFMNQPEGCPLCYDSISKAEKEIFNQIKTQFPDLEVLQQKYFGRFSADICIEDIKLIIEYNGTFWHCDPRKYRPEYVNPRLKKFAKEVWEKDERKISTFKSAGYSTITIWEDDYIESPQHAISKVFEWITNLKNRLAIN